NIMTSFLRYAIALVSLCSMSVLFGAENIVNVYTWAEEIPHFIIAEFEKETGIKVNYATYDSNEIMYAKLLTTNRAGYDVIEPSSYYIDRMRNEGMLEKLNKNKLTNLKHLDPFFLNQVYDPQSNYSIPFVWGMTGIFFNKDYFSPNTIVQWSDLTDKKYKN